MSNKRHEHVSPTEISKQLNSTEYASKLEKYYCTYIRSISNFTI